MPLIIFITEIRKIIILLNTVVTHIERISIISLILYLYIVKYPWEELFYILINIKFESGLQLSKELDLHRNTVGRYHKRIHDFLLENNENSSFDGAVEMDELILLTWCKRYKKTKKLMDYQKNF
jgi:hypothetical protein